MDLWLWFLILPAAATSLYVLPVLQTRPRRRTTRPARRPIRPRAPATARARPAVSVNSLCVDRLAFAQLAPARPVCCNTSADRVVCFGALTPSCVAQTRRRRLTTRLKAPATAPRAPAVSIRSLFPVARRLARRCQLAPYLTLFAVGAIRFQRSVSPSLVSHTCFASAQTRPRARATARPARAIRRRARPTRRRARAVSPPFVRRGACCFHCCCFQCPSYMMMLVRIRCFACLCPLAPPLR